MGPLTAGFNAAAEGFRLVRAFWEGMSDDQRERYAEPLVKMAERHEARVEKFLARFEKDNP